jgi:hypothetical protein
MALAAAFIVWIVVDHAGGTASPVTTVEANPTTAPRSTTETTPAPVGTPFGPIALSAAGLRNRVAALGHPVYWIGPEQGRRYELKLTDDGSVFLRYLPPGVEAGDTRALRTVGTYPVAGAYAVTQGVAKEQGAVWRTLADGALAVFNSSRPTNIYLAYPTSDDLQIEIFDPSASEARRLAFSGKLRPLR